MRSHLSLDVLALPEVERPLDAAQHLAACPRCRVEARMLALGDDGPVDLSVQRSLDAHRHTLSAQIQCSMDTIHQSTWQVQLQTTADRPKTSGPSGSLSNYTLKRWLGVGTDTIAHLAVDTRSQQPCVVKLYHAARTRMGPDHALRKRIQALRHRNLGVLLDGGDGDAAFIVLERVDGPDLVTWIRDVGVSAPRATRVDLRRVRTAFQQVVAGLRALEAIGMAHGRLHPGNIRVDGAGRVVLLDYALPGPDPLAANVPDWNPGVVYRAPEHRSAGGGSIEGDLYALGVVMAEALIGERPRHEAPFAARTTEVPADLRHLVTELLQVQPGDRPPLVEVAARLGIDRLPTEVRSDRYDDLGTLGRGGMGEVRRVLDRELNRTLAMKVAKSEIDASRTARFVAEAQLTAQLQHPAIVPVHEMGRLPDGRTYFTMKEIRGRDLGAIIRAYHSPAGAADAGDPDAWPLRRIVEALHRVCQAVAYSHTRGVVHRDLKPDNIMVGDFGEVLVVDWGIAKSVGVDVGTDEDPILTVGQAGQSTVTMTGTLTGTPSYMPPELFQPGGHPVSPRADVYALGATLYHVLAGRPPFMGKDHMVVVATVIDGPPPSIRETLISQQPVPDDLVTITAHAMARDPLDRPADASGMARALGEWLDGARARDRAIELVEHAAELLPDIERLRRDSADLQRQATVQLQDIQKNAPVSEKAAAWALEDQAKQAGLQATLATVEFEKSLRAALSHVHEFPDAMDMLAAHHRRLHAAAESERNAEGCARHEALLRAYDTGRNAEYLRGVGALTLHTEPIGASVQLQRYEDVNRRLVLGEPTALGTAPLDQISLDMGSYLLTLSAPGRATVRLPVRVTRQGHHDNVPPGSDETQPVYLPTGDKLGPLDVVVPAGWVSLGGTGTSWDALPRMKIWVNDFVLRRHPVTNREYIAFLDDLVAQGREAEALEHVPRERAATVSELGVMIYGRTDAGTFELRPDADGDLWFPDMPVVMVSWFGARAYTEWEAARTGVPWRLPWEMEWEKAARGVDLRSFPWGDVLDPTFCCMRHSHGERSMVAAVGLYEVDESPYGVRGMAGNVIDWCNDAYLPDGIEVVDGHFQVPPSPGIGPEAVIRVIRGGGWISKPAQVYAIARDLNDDFNRASYVGFRLARSLMSGE